jgi:predicted phage terminase large subunit-like protein
MPGGAIIVIMTRWSLLDLTGRLIDYQIKNPDTIPWEIVELPAILDAGTDHEKSLWPAQWSLEALKNTQASIDPRYWNAQYMQNPTSDMSAIVSRKDWQVWEGDDPPPCEFIIQSWDTAHETKTTSDYSACTTWGIWYNNEDKGNPNIILLDAFKERLTFPDLKIAALKYYKEWQPDAFIVEKKASGGPLIQELRLIGIPVQEFTPSRGNDKMVRLNAVADLFTSGKVWAPDTRWAREVVEEIASFPVGEHDDYVDTTTQALLRYRQGGFISLDTDERDDLAYKYRRKAAYY